MATVLVVDDNDELRALLVQQLQRVGHRVLAAGNGKEASQLLAHADLGIDLVITDIFMPEKDGIETVLECKSRGLPVLAMSGGDAHGNASTLETAQILGAVHVLRKPFSNDELMVAVDAVIRKT